MSEHEPKQLVEILLKFDATLLSKNPIAIAKGFAKNRMQEIKNKERQKQIGYFLKQLIAEPQDDFFTALATIEGVWGDLEPKPSASELSSVWQAMSSTADAKKKSKKGEVPE